MICNWWKFFIKLSECPRFKNTRSLSVSFMGQDCHLAWMIIGKHMFRVQVCLDPLYQDLFIRLYEIDKGPKTQVRGSCWKHVGLDPFQISSPKSRRGWHGDLDPFCKGEKAYVRGSQGWQCKLAKKKFPIVPIWILCVKVLN